MNNTIWQPLSKVERDAPRTKDGYVEFVKSHPGCSPERDGFRCSCEVWVEIRNAFPMAPLPPYKGDKITLGPGRVLQIPMRKGEKPAEREEPALPSMGHMAYNASRAAITAMGAIIKGETVLRTEEQAEALHNICRTSGEGGGFCKFYRASDMRCAHSKCGCFLDAKQTKPPSKTRLATAFCPIGMWPAPDKKEV